MLATIHGHVDVVNLLMAAGADIHVQDEVSVWDDGAILMQL